MAKNQTDASARSNSADSNNKDKEGYPLASLQVHQAATVRNATESNFRAEKGYEMRYTEEGVFVEYKDIKFIVPLANVIIAVLK